MSSLVGEGKHAFTWCNGVMDLRCASTHLSASSIEYYLNVVVVRIQNARPWMSLERVCVYEVLFVGCFFGGQVEARGPMHGLSPAQAQRKRPFPYMVVIRREYEVLKSLHSSVGFSPWNEISNLREMDER